MSGQKDSWMTPYKTFQVDWKQGWNLVLFYEGRQEWGKHSSLIKPHDTDCDGHCDSCWTSLVFFILETGQSFCLTRSWEHDFGEFVDRTPGFAELIAEHPRAMNERNLATK